MVYSCPTIKPLYFTLSTIVVFSLLTACWFPVSLSLAVVCISCLGNSTVCPLSLISVWVATSVSCTYKCSKTTTACPCSALLSKVNSSSTYPSGFSALKVFSAVTGFPFTSSSLPVDLSINTPFTVYSCPTIKPLYFTLSTIVVFSLLTACWFPVSLSLAVVCISCFGNVTVWSLSSKSSCAAISISPIYAFSKTTISFPANWEALNLNRFSIDCSDFSAINFISAVTSFPSTRSGFWVSLSIRIPFTTTSAPTCRFLKLTVSLICTSAFVIPSCPPVSTLTALVFVISVLAFSIVNSPSPFTFPFSSMVNS